MGKFNKYYKIDHDNHTYAVCELSYTTKTTTKTAPVIMDWNVFQEIKNLNKNWHINDKGFVVTTHKYTADAANSVDTVDKVREISLHDVVMKISDGILQPKSILHIDKLGVDNRRENLDYDTNNKDITKNLKKKSRTLELPEDCGIIPDEIPSYVWYLKEDSTHGNRFIINIGDVKWKSTASKKVSLKYKLEETKKYMRHLKTIRSDLFDDYSMNGDLNEDGLLLIDEFIKISQKAGFNLNNDVIQKNTNKFLKQNLDGLTEEEIMLLDLFNPEGERHDFRI